MAKLYELQDQLVAIDNILENNTDPESQEILETAKEEVLKEINGKIENVLNFISDCNAKCDQLSEEIKRLTAKKKTLDNKSEYLKNLVYTTMKASGIIKAAYGNWDCTIAKNTPKVVIDDEQWIPDSCCKVVRTVDKTELKKCMWNGEYRKTIDGQDILIAHIEQGESLRIK